MSALASNDFHALDDSTLALYLEVPSSSVVLLQGYFELYEGVGTVRTIDRKRALVSILTPSTQCDICIQLLESIHNEISWHVAPYTDNA